MRRPDVAAGRRLDAGLVVGVAGLLLVGARVAASDADQTALTLPGAALLVASAGVLWWRRQHPVAVAMVAGLFATIYGIAELPDPPLPIAVVVALYCVGRWCTRRTTALAAVAVGASVLVGLVVTGDSGPGDYYRNLVPALAALIVGDQVRERAHAERARRRADLEAAARADRDHLARELHDIVAHHVSMSIVQAEAGAAGCDASGDGKGAARFDEIAASGRGALADLRRLLDVLHEDGAGPATPPQPQLSDLPALMERVRSAGVPVELIAEGTPIELSSSASTSAYRIVQEALTNVIRHAGGAATRVYVRWQPSHLAIEVGNEATDEAAPVRAGGRGLQGIDQRAALLGGTASAGPRPDGGFEVSATIPYSEVAR